MQYRQMLDSVKARLGVDDDEAAEALAGVVSVLAECLTSDEADDLLSQLPEDLRGGIQVPSDVSIMEADEFVARVAEVEAVESDLARAHTQAVFATLREAVTYGEFSDVLEELGPEYVELLG